MVELKPKTKIDYKGQTELLKPFWDSILKEKDYFTVKVAYRTSKNKTQDIVRVFASEMSKGEFYCEFIGLDELNYFDDRRLYKLPYDKDFHKKFEAVAGSVDQYLVPLTAFTLVEQVTSKSAYTPRVKTINEEVMKYPSVFELDALDLYALMHNKAISEKEVINKIINRNK